MEGKPSDLNVLLMVSETFFVVIWSNGPFFSLETAVKCTPRNFKAITKQSKFNTDAPISAPCDSYKS